MEKRIISTEIIEEDVKTENNLRPLEIQSNEAKEYL